MDADFAKEHPYIYLSANGEHMIFQITALFITDIGFDYIAPNPKGDDLTCFFETIARKKWLDFDGVTFSEEDSVLTVSELRYHRTGSCRHPRPHPSCIYNWPHKTLYDIPSRKEYLGHTVTAKKCKVFYKSKTTRVNPDDKRCFFPNTHEALVDEETFDLAQKRIATRHRPTKNEEIDLFSGLLFCGDCDYKMYLQQGADTLERKHAYTCGRYRNRILVYELDKNTNTRKIEIFYSFVSRVDTGDKPTESISYFRQIGADVKSYAI